MTRLLAGKLTGKIKGVLGLDRCHTFCTGAAPISVEVLEVFGSLDINVLELFGMSETTGPTNMNTASDFRIGQCGLQIPGTVTKTDPATGEVIFTGRHLMMGYMYNEEATTKTIDPDGWLHSGDIGKVDEDGYLKITGRIKEILITAGGENVAPVLIEDELKKQLPCISNAMVIGDQKKYLTVLLCSSHRVSLLLVRRRRGASPAAAARFRRRGVGGSPAAAAFFRRRGAGGVSRSRAAAATRR